MKHYVIVTAYGALAIFTAGVMFERAIIAYMAETMDIYFGGLMCLFLLMAAQLDNKSVPSGKIARHHGDVFWHMEDNNG